MAEKASSTRACNMDVRQEKITCGIRKSRKFFLHVVYCSNIIALVNISRSYIL
jgi:hypothetical protein